MANEFVARNGIIAKDNSTITGTLAVSGNITMGGLLVATQSWVTTRGYATESYVTTAINNLIDSAPGALDTLNELAAALGDDPNFATTVTNNIASKVSKSGDTMTGNINWNTQNTGLTWNMNTDGAYIKFFNTGDGDTNSRLEYSTSDNGDEYHRWVIAGVEKMYLKWGGLTVTDTIYASGGNSSNWNTAYGWGNHASAGYQSASTAVELFDYLWTNPVFGQYGIKNNLIDNILYSAQQRFTVLKNGGAYGGDLFNANYDQWQDIIPAGQSATYTIQFNTKNNPSYGIVYPWGKIYLSFYYVQIPASVVGRSKDQNGVWSNLSGWTNVANNGSYAVWSADINGSNYLVELEITITAAAGIDTWFAQWEYVLGRPGQFENGIISKFQDNSIWRSLFFKDSNNNNRVNISSNGIITDQQLTINGTNSLYFGSYGGGWYMADGSWVRTVSGKSVWTGGGVLGSDGGLTIGYGGTSHGTGNAVIAGVLGIGTSSPSYKLQVNGNAAFATNSGGLRIDSYDADTAVIRPSVANGSVLISDDSGTLARGTEFLNGGGIVVQSLSGFAPLEVKSNSISRLSVAANGYVGIGISNPLNVLEVRNGSGTTGYSGNDLVFYNGNGQSAFYHDAGGYVYWYSNQAITFYPGASRSVTFSTNGNVGIGTTSPSYKLDISGNSRTSGIHYVDTYLVTPYIYGGGPITMGNNVVIDSTEDGKLTLKVPSGDSSEWNYINFTGSNGVRDAYLGTDGGGTPTWYRDDNGVNITLGSSVLINGNTAWHAGNDGSGSGLDADLLDGQHASYFINTSNIGSQSVSYATSAGSASTATEVVTLQDNPPAGVNGKLWWETDTGKLKVYYGASSAWVDALPMPDMTLYLSTAGGAISGDLSIAQTLTVTGNILSSAVITASGGNSTQWNTAYGWGNHASAGYLTSYTETDTLATVTARGSSTNGSIYVNGLLTGGLGAATTSGTLDWNDSSNARAGQGYTLLLGSHTNGPGPGEYFHPVGFEYGSKDGSGNVTQLAISYGSPGDKMYMRGRYSGSWTGWTQFITSANIGSQSVNYASSAGNASNADTLDSLDSTNFMRSYGMLNNTDVYVNFRVIQNNNSSSANDGLYIGYNNSNSGVTRIFGGGATSGGLVVGGAGVNDVSIAGNTVWNSGNDGAGSGLDADLLDGQHASAFAAASHNHDDRYYTETESDARYPLSRGTLGTTTNVGDSTGFGNNLASGTYTRNYVGHSGQVWMSHDTGGSTGNFALEVTYYGAMYVHTNVDSSSWVTKQIWTAENFTSTNITNWNTAYGWGNHASQGYATQTYVNTAIANLVDSAPSTLDTLNELAAALGDDPNFATTVTNSIAAKLPLAGGTMTGKIFTVSTGTGTYDTAIEIREQGYVTTSQSAWGYSPAMTFHWGGRHAIRFGLRSDGLMAVDDAPIALRSWVQAQGYLTSESDTLNSVTGRGNTTSNSVRFGSYVDLSATGSAFRFYDGTTFRGGLGLDDWAHGGSAANITAYVNGDNNFFISTSGTYRAQFNSGAAIFRTYSADNAYNIRITGGDQFNAYYNDSVATLYLQYHNGNGGTLNVGNGKLTVNTAGSVVASGDMRAPIFYDSNDTNYYLDLSSSSNSSYAAGVFRQNNGKYVRDSSYRTYSGYSDYYSAGNAGWYRVAEITLTSNCSGAVLYGTLYDHRYDGADAYQVSIVARAECSFTSDNEQHYINVGCTILGSTNYVDYKSKIRVVLSASSAGSRTYEVQFYETNWNHDTWQLETTGWTVYTTPQAPRTAVGTPKVYYISNQNADYQRANTATYSPVYYDSDDTTYYADFNSTSGSAIKLRGGILTGPNPSWSQYLQLGGDGNNPSHATVAVTNGNLHVDAKNGYATYINHYYGNKIYLGSGGAAGGTYTHSNFSLAGNLNLGGGDGDASHRLQVIGNALVQGTQGFNAAGETASLYIGDTASEIRAVFDGGLDFYQNSVHRVRIEGGTGNFGIGTSDPNYKLHVAGNAYINETLFVNQQTTIEDNLLVTQGIGQNNLIGRPAVMWSASGASAGAVVIKFPGNTANYGMVHAVVDIYEYSGNTVSTIIIGGHNWNGAWYSYGANLIGQTDKQVRLAVVDGSYAIVIGDNSSSWSYGQVVLRKIQNGGYYQNVMNVYDGYTTSQTTSLSASWISADLRRLVVSGVITANGGNSGEWNTAYSWGNHASAGYLTTESDTLATVTGRGASTSTALTFSGGSGSTPTLALDRNIATPSNYYNGLQFEVRATSGTAGIGLHRNGYSHVGIYHDSPNELKFNMNSGTPVLSATAGTIWGSGNDGSGSGLDADLLDGVDSGSFLRSDADDSFSGTLTMSTQKALVASNYGHGVYGVYDASIYQHVWSMGVSYNLPANGVSSGNGGNLYGLAWSYNPDYGYSGSNAQSKPGLNHQLLLMMNGVTHTALGSGIWTNGLITTVNHGTSANWKAAYDWGNHASAGYLTAEADTLATVTARGASTSTDLTFNGTLTMGTGGTQYIRMGRFPASITNTGEAWIGRASDRSTGTMTVQLGNDGARIFEIVDHAWSTVILNVGMNSFSYKGNTIWHSGNDGAGSGLDADLLDGQDGSYYQPASTAITTSNIGSQSVLYATSAGSSTNLYGSAGSYIKMSTSGTSYQNNYQVRENDGGGSNTNEIYAPQLAFHWSGVVASSIMMEASGRIAIRNNPGTGYEAFIAGIVYSSGYGNSTEWNTAYSWGNHAGLYAAASHTHDDRYYTESESDSRFVNVSGDTMNGSLSFDAAAVIKKKITGVGDNPVKTASGVLASRSDNSGGFTYYVIETTVPQDNYQMGGFTIELFGSYGSTNHKTKIDLGGYWNPESNGGFEGFEAHGTNPQYKPTIEVARNSAGNTAFIIYGVSWSYPVIVARDLWLGYNSTDPGTYGEGWTIAGTNDVSSYTNKDTVVWRNAYSDSNPAGYISGNQTITLSGDVSGSGTTSISVTVNNIDGWGFVNTGSNSPTDADTINSNGISYYTGGVTNFSGNATDGALYSQRYSDSWQHQIAGDYRSGMIAVRGKNNGTWTSWKTIIDSSTIGSQSVAYATSAGSATSATSASSATSATQVVTIQDNPPSGSNGQLWWESDTGKLKVYYGSSSAWVDATPVPDMSLYYAKAGGPISGDVTVQQTLTVVGNTLIQGTLTETSDISLKENIVPLESSLDKVMQLNGVSFNKKATPNVKEIGFIAQEVEAVIPDLVTETNEGIKTVSYSRVTAVLVETIKEQQAQIEELKNMVNMLAEKLNNL